MELQRARADFEAAGVGLYALSYDEADALGDFRDAHHITYPLLSDPDSEVIGAFGILNTLIDPDDHPWYGIPYPGSFVMDSAGVITHKFFDNNLAVRTGPEQLLRAATGQAPAAAAAAAARSIQPADEATVSIYLDAPALTPTVQKDLVIQFHVPEGRHIYSDPAPAGSVGVSVALDTNERIVERPLLRPRSEPHTLAGTSETFDVHHGRFELRLPLTVNGRISDPEHDKGLTLSGTVRWQVCDDEVCDIPRSQRFEISVPVQDSPPLALGSEAGAALEPKALEHFQKMKARREKR